MIELLADDSGYCTYYSADRDASATVEAFGKAYNAHDIPGLKAVLAVNAQFLNGAATPATERLADWEGRIFPETPALRFTASHRQSRYDLVTQIEAYEGGDAAGEELAAYRVEGGCIVEVHMSNEHRVDSNQ